MSDPWDDLFSDAGDGELEQQRSLDRLWRAVRRNDQDEVARVLTEEPAAALTSNLGYFVDCFHEAVRGGNAEIVGMLLRNGASPNAANASGITPLWLAASAGAGSVVQLLVRHGADPNVTPELIDPEIGEARHGESPLLFAALWEDRELVKFLWSRTDSTTREKARAVMRRRLRLLDEDRSTGTGNTEPRLRDPR